MVSLGQVALDGTKVRANASRRKAMSYQRLTEKQKILAAEVSDLLADADAIDKAEDARFGRDKRGGELPDELARRESRLVKLKAAREQLEADAAVKARKDAPTAQRNFTDPDSRIMKTADGSFHYCYNAQAVVDVDHQVIVVTTLTNIAVDVEQVVPLVAKLQETVGVLPGQVLADAGYCSNKNLEYVQTIEGESGGHPEFFIATGRQKHDDVLAEPDGVLPTDASLRERMARKLKTEAGKKATGYSSERTSVGGWSLLTGRTAVWTFRDLRASFVPGSVPMRHAWTTSTGYAGRPVLSARRVVRLAGGGSGTDGTSATAAGSAPR